MATVQTFQRAGLASICRAFVPCAGLTVALGAPAARAQQISTIPSYAAIVETDDAVLRASAGDLYYPVAKLNKGTLLRVDGEGADSKGKPWLRVSYPQHAWVYLAADSVQADPAGKSGTITKLVQPKAPSLTLGFKGSWMPALPQGLQPGSKVTILEVEPGPGGQGVSAYRITAPDTARAFIAPTSVRKATPQEAAAFAAGNPGPAGITPAPMAAGPASRPSTGPSTGPSTNPSGGPATTAQSGSPANLAEPMAPRPGVAAPETAAGHAPTGDNAPAVAIDQSPVTPKPSPYERLESSFQELRGAPADTAEYTELLNEYQAEIEKLDDTPANASMRARLNQRVQYLKIAADLQSARRRVAEQQQSLSEDDQRLRERMAEVDRARQYTIVGRLSASTLYDGKRLPLMYRVQTVGGPSPRTLAYVKPDEKLGIDGKIGELVGVVGEARMDPTLKLNIITPLRIDTLEATPAPAEASVPTP
jgi:hypothetical protein